MAPQEVDTVRRFIDAWNRRDTDAVLECFDPDCEVIFPAEVPEPGPFHGREELRGWVERFQAAWEVYSAEIAELAEAGDRVVAVARQTGRGAGSGLEVDETDAHLFEFRGGRIARWQNFNGPQEAFEAAGLRRAE